MIVDYYSMDGGIDMDVFQAKCQPVAEELGVRLVSVASRRNDKHQPPLGCNIIRVVLEGSKSACEAFVSKMVRVTSD